MSELQGNDANKPAGCTSLRAFCKPKAFISPLGVKFLRFIPTADKFDPIKVKAEAAAYPKTHLFVDSGYHLEGM